MHRALHMVEVLRYRAITDSPCTASPSSCCMDAWYATDAAYTEHGGDECLDAWIDYAYPRGGTNPSCIQPMTATAFDNEDEQTMMISIMNDWFGHNLDSGTYGTNSYVTHAYRKLTSCIFFHSRFQEYAAIVTNEKIKENDMFKSLFPPPLVKKLSNRELNDRISEFKKQYMNLLRKHLPQSAHAANELLFAHRR